MEVSERLNVVGSTAETNGVIRRAPRKLVSSSALNTAYLAAIVVGGAIVALASARELIAAPIGLPWFVLAGLIVLSGSATLRLPTASVSCWRPAASLR